MSRKNPTLAEAVKVPGFTLTLDRQFVEDMSVLEALVTAHGKSEGVAKWAAQTVHHYHLAMAQDRRSGFSYRWPNGMGLGRDAVLDLSRPADRLKLAGLFRERAKWWLRQGLTAEQARAYVGPLTQLDEGK